MNNILIIGGDKRTLQIIKILQKDNNVDIIGFDTLELDTVDFKELNIKKYNVIIFPIDGIHDDYSITCPFSSKNISVKEINFNKCIIFSGIGSKKLDETFKSDYIKLMSFDDVAIENSISTSEGIIADIIQNTDYTLNNSNITVLGYGRVGKTLVNKLLKLGANVNVGVIKELDYISLIYENINVFYTTDMKNNLINSDIIINTVPKLLLDKINLNYTKKDVYIIDIASAPYGVDFECAKDKKIKYTILKGIPGKVAPKTAGTILANKINKILKEAL